MRKYFVIAFVLMVILLLVLGKQTEQKRVSPEKAEVVGAAPDVVENAAAPTPAAPTAITVPTDATPAPAVQAGLVLTTEAVDRLRNVAKMSLTASYTSQKAILAEWDRYTSDLVYTGWEPPTSELGFKMGFLSALEQPLFADGRENPQRFTTDAFLNRVIQGQPTVRYTPAAAKINLSDYTRYCERGCVASTDWFEMMLVIPLDEIGHVDVWTVNDQKDVKLVLDGTKP